MDRLIRGVVRQGRRFASDELLLVRAHAANRPFSQQIVEAGRDLVGMQDSQGRILTLRTRLPSLEQHWLKHVVHDQQWQVGTSQIGYLDDLRRAMMHPQARVFTYRYRGESYACFLAPDDFTSKGVVSYPYLFVAYSATWAVVRTGYKAVGFASVFRRQRPTDLVEHM